MLEKKSSIYFQTKKKKKMFMCGNDKIDFVSTLSRTRKKQSFTKSHEKQSNQRHIIN